MVDDDIKRGNAHFGDAVVLVADGGDAFLHRQHHLVCKLLLLRLGVAAGTGISLIEGSFILMQSFEKVFRVVINPEFFQEIFIFLFKRVRFVMFGLIQNIFHHHVDVRF